MGSEVSFEEILLKISESEGQISEVNYTDVDALIFAELSGIDIKKLGLQNTFKYVGETKSAAYEDFNVDYSPAELVKRYEAMYNEDELQGNDKYRLLKAIASSKRYKDIRLGNFAHCTNKEYKDEMGNVYAVSYKAITVDLGDTKVIAYAGTGASIFSWLEDGRMASAKDGIGAQVWGKEYAEFVMNLDSDNILFGGYSKGGNQALYSSIYLQENYGDRIKKVINVDGPGFSDQALMELVGEKTFYTIWREMCEKGIIDETTTPYESFVGHLMSDHAKYNYIQGSHWLFVANHHYQNWSITLDEQGNPTFVKCDSDEMAEVSHELERLVNGILETVPAEQFTQFVDVLDKFCRFHLVGTTDDLGKITNNKSFNQISLEFIEFYNNELTESEKKAFDATLQAILKDDNLENFLKAWRVQLQNTKNDEALKLASQLEQFEAFYPAITGAVETLTLNELITALGIINGYLDSVGGAEQLATMEGTEIILSAVDYYYSLPLNQQNIFFKTVTDALYGGALNQLKEDSLIWAAGLWIAGTISKFDPTHQMERFAKLLMNVIIGFVTAVCLAIEFGEAIYEAYIFVKERVLEFVEKMKNMIETAISKIKDWLKNVLETIVKKVTKTVEAGKYVVKEQIIKFNLVWSVTIPNPVVRLSAIITYALKSAYTAAHIHIEYDLTKLSGLLQRLERAASKASSLEYELSSFYSYLKSTKVKVSEKKEITLAKKYGISRRDLTPDKAGTLRSASGRFSTAYSKLYYLDGSLLA